jgi:hypothetical protein
MTAECDIYNKVLTAENPDSLSSKERDRRAEFGIVTEMTCGIRVAVAVALERSTKN